MSIKYYWSYDGVLLDGAMLTEGNVAESTGVAGVEGES